MMFKKFLVAGIAALTLVAGNVMAEGNSRLRFMFNPSVSYSGDRYMPSDGSTTTPGSDVSGGYGIAYVTSGGLGFGYSSTDVTTEDSGTTTVGGITVPYPYGILDSTQFVDVSYTFGEDLTGTVLLGYGIGGTMTGTNTTEEPGSFESGTAFGLVGGYDLGFMELLLGYRSETVKYGTFDRSRAITQFGIGFTF